MFSYLDDMYEQTLSVMDYPECRSTAGIVEYGNSYGSHCSSSSFEDENSFLCGDSVSFVL